MQSEPQSFKIHITAEDLKAIQSVLQQCCISQSKTFEATVSERIGFAGRLSNWQLISLLFGGALISSLLLATTRSDETFGRLVCGGLALFFWGYLIAMIFFGQDRIKAATRRFVTNPLIRGTVNLEIRRAIKRAPFSVVYQFRDANYTASSPELKAERSISFDEISVAYRDDSVFCLFKGNRSAATAVIHAREEDQRKVVEAALKRNQVEVHEISVCLETLA